MPASPHAPVFGHLTTQTFLTALDLGILHKLARGPATARALARAAGANARATRMLLDALVGQGQLERTGDSYALPQPMQAALRCPGVDAEGFFDDTRIHLEFLLRTWSRLTDVVRTGKPVCSMDDAEDAGENFPVLVRRLFPINYLASKHLVGQLPKRFQTKPLTVLDVGCGSACWSIPFAEANAGTRVTALDFAPVLDVADHYLQACGVEEQYTRQAGDLRRTPLGREKYDVALLGHICHSEGEVRTKRLFRKVAKALTPGGLMLIVDMFVDEKRVGAGAGGFALTFALNMLVNTDKGGCYRVSDYKAWAKAAGFRRYVGGLDALGQSPVLAFAR